VTVSGLALGDIQIYKDGGTTQRASTSGFALLDTDGIDFDTTTGIHGISIDLSDNTTAGFFAAGSEYSIVIASVTVDAATVNFVAGAFSIERAGGAIALLKGTNSLANIEDKIDIIDTNVDQIETAVITNAVGVDIAADIIALKAETVLIVADTNELQTDWANAGRLDTILDARMAEASINTTGGAVDVVTVLTGHTAQTGDSFARIGAGGASLGDLGGMSTGMKAEVNAEADTALTDYDGPTNAEMEARTPTAAQLAYIVANAATGLPVTFTTSGGSTTAAVLNLVDGSAGSATNDQYNGRLLVFTDGTLKGVVTDITDYVGSTTTATITAIPFAPTSSHNARLI